MDALSPEGKVAVVSRPLLYVVMIVAAMLAAYVYKVRVDGIFACPATGYSSDRYLAYCHAGGYGDYEHGTFWFGLEPSARAFAAEADVLFLGDSRIQIAMSTPATEDWFASTLARYYLLGFSYGEDVIFADGLLRKIRPQAKVIVTNIDPFFARTETAPTAAVMHDPVALANYRAKQLWQRVHKPLCNAVAPLCGNKYVVFRSRQTGAYHVDGESPARGISISYDSAINQKLVSDYTASAKDFLSRLPVKNDCIILAAVPTVGTQIETAQAIATALGVTLIAPRLDGLQTFDGSHMDAPSAERWSKAFFEEAGPQIRKCLDKPQTSNG